MYKTAKRFMTKKNQKLVLLNEEKITNKTVIVHQKTRNLVETFGKKKVSLFMDVLVWQNSGSEEINRKLFAF